MSTPSPVVLICPQCRKKFRGDPAQPAARYRCPEDRTPLVREEAPQQQETLDLDSAKKMTADFSAMGNGGAGVDPDMTAYSPGTAPAASQPATASQSASASQTGSEARRSVVASLTGGGVRAGGMSENAEKYEITGKLGQGGMGQVLKVMDRDLKREVAMKMLLAPRGVTASQDSLLRFVDEAQATGQLEHPNIVPVHDLGVDGEGRVYFTLKYVQGDSLKKVFKGRADNQPIEADNPAAGTYRTAYDPRRMIGILIDICQGVAYAHAKGVIHRDLKPDNIMLGKFGEVLVMDWGLAKLVSAGGAAGTEGVGADDAASMVMTSRAEDGSLMTMEGAVAGTPAYMSPEQASGKISELDGRTDIYALGAILYEILSGHTPYGGGGALEIVEKVKAGPPPPLGAGIVDFHPIPRELKAVCAKAMAREPGGRYETALQLRDDLQAWLDEREVSAAPDSVLRKFGKWAKRNRRPLLTAAASALVVTAAALGWIYGGRQLAVRKLMTQAQNEFNAAQTLIKAPAEAAPQAANSDPYAGLRLISSRGEKFGIIRAALGRAIEPARKVLDLTPAHPGARALLADSHMELWRLALAEDNRELMKAQRTDVAVYAGTPNKYQAELEGRGSLDLTLTPAEATAHLFRHELLLARGKDGIPLPARLIPVPFDLTAGAADRNFLLEEAKRAESGEGPLPGEKSIFKFPATPGNLLKGGEVGLPPGSYLLLLKNGAVEIRVPVTVGRGEKVARQITVPAAGDIPPGFVYIAGGGAGPVGAVNGANAGASSAHPMSIFDALIAREETTMRDYGEFLADLAKKNPAEATRRLPHDFGAGNAITLMAKLQGGRLVPALPDPQFDASAVRGVTLDDARAYIAWKSAKDNLPYRLPKDWEWELACRGADGRNFSWGDEPAANYAVVTQGYGMSSADMSWRWSDYKDESVWGVHNMAGGAAEWTASEFNPAAAEGDPVKGQYAIRGNAWALPPVGLMCNFRTSGQPGYFHPTIGFRLALDYPVVPGVSTPEQLKLPLAEHNHAEHH